MNETEDVSAIEADDSDNSLAAWSSIIHEQGERMRKEREQEVALVNAREPDVIVRPKGEGYHYGYFRADNGAGVVRFTRWGGGEWLPETKTEYTFEEIKALASFL